MTLRELRQATFINITKLNVEGEEFKEITTRISRDMSDYIVTDIVPYAKVVNFDDNSSVRIDCGICVYLEKSEKDKLIDQLLENEEICDFRTVDEMLDYFNTYGSKKFKDQEEMFNCIDGYYFKYKDWYYCINFDETKEKLKQGGIL